MLSKNNKPRLGGWDKQDLVFNQGRVSGWGEVKVLQLDGGDGCTVTWNVLNATEMYV